MVYGFKRYKTTYNPQSSSPYKLSRSKIDLFIECPRCFYLDRRLWISRPDTPPYTLNNAVDTLFKNEFDLLRKKKKPHALMEKYHIDAIPFQHKDLPVWRDDVRRYTGACTVHKETNLQICGIVDDLWVNPQGEIIIVDYKATSTVRKISLDDQWKAGYKRQMEIYQWIFRQNGFKVADTGYFVFANAIKNRDKFDGRLEFEVSILPYKGNPNWVEKTIQEIKKCLDSDRIPQPNPKCKYCSYRREVGQKIKARLI
jgi:CRISPR/Cas system-associated exonuclease Cas4 (RecB family)